MEKSIRLLEWMMKLIEKCHDGAINGLSVTKSCKQCNNK